MNTRHVPPIRLGLRPAQVALMVLLLVGAMFPARIWADQLLYLASSKDKSIVAYAVNNENGALDKKFRFELPGNAGPLAYSPDKSYVYAAVTGLAGGKAGVATLKRATDGTLSLVRTVPITTRTAYCRVDKTGKFLLCAHYGAGDVTVYRITDGVCTGELLDQQKTTRTAHCIELDPSGKFAFVPHPAPNAVYQFRLNLDSGKLSPNDPPFATGPETNYKYHGPRHYAHHPKLNMAYTSNETGGGITAWKFDPKTGKLTRRQTLLTLPPEYEGTSAAADIKITPDGRFAYVSNRDTTKRPDGEKHRDTLAGVALDPKTGSMRLIGHFPTAFFPRSFCIDSDGHFLFAAGQRDNTLVAYRIDQRSGRLKQLASYSTGGGPIWVMTGP